MEVVNRLPRPTNPAAFARLVDAQKILCAKFVSDEDCQQAVDLLSELAKPTDEGGFGYFPALLTLASLYDTGFEPGIERNGILAAETYLMLLGMPDVSTAVPADLLDEASMQLCGLVKDGRATLSDKFVEEMKRLSRREGAGAVGSVASWMRYAVLDAERMIQEAKEDPAVRKAREAMRKEREERRANELSRQRACAEKALAEAEKYRQEGNDCYRKGNLPGNSMKRQDLLQAVGFYDRASNVLSECLDGLTIAVEEAESLKRQRGVLHSNAAQVQITLGNWVEAVELAELALKGDPNGIKSQYRLARALAGAGNWLEAARKADAALVQFSRRSGEEDSMLLDIWKLAQDISGHLPDWQWSVSKPKSSDQRAKQDYEHRVVGRWEYGSPGGNQCFEVVLEKWGALVWKEGEMKIDLFRKSSLRWRGEYEMISGMVVHVSYEPGSDVLITEFTPPPDVPEEQRYKGPCRFTARRVVQPEPDPCESGDIDVNESEPQAQTSSPCACDDENEAWTPPKAKLEEWPPKESPRELWLIGHERCAGRYLLAEDEEAAQFGTGGGAGGRAIYRRCENEPLCLWYRGGNWGITANLNLSSFAAPFLIRCPAGDVAGGRTTRHPMQIRRPRWHVAKRRVFEEFDSAVALKDTCPASASVGQDSAVSSTQVVQNAPQDEKTTTGVASQLLLSGRSGSHVEVNGLYELTQTTWVGRPTYVQIEPPLPIDQQTPLYLFFDHGLWVVARGLSNLPRVLARRRPPNADSTQPFDSDCEPWFFLHDEEQKSLMVNAETRMYAPDRDFAVRQVPTARFSDQGHVKKNESSERHTNLRPVSTDSASTCNQSSLPRWASTGDVQFESDEVLISIVVRGYVDVDVQNVNLDVGQRSIRVGIASQDGVYECTLPQGSKVDEEANANAKWIERTRSLRIRIALRN